MTPLDAIKKIYYTTTRATIERDFQKAIQLLKSLPTIEEREQATVFMHGLAEMRKEWTSARHRRRHQ
jgi:alpha-galactosidase/6-phospho-beta-glucosidase family protein